MHLAECWSGVSSLKVLAAVIIRIIVTVIIINFILIINVIIARPTTIILVKIRHLD